MAEHERQLRLRELAVENMQIGAADPAGKHPQAKLMRRRLRHRQLGRVKRDPGPVEHHRLYGWRGHRPIVTRLRINSTPYPAS
jgi:hypothetical protein